MSLQSNPSIEEKVPEACRALGVDSDASDREIKSAFHRWARLLHPDVAGNDRTSNERFKRLVEAYNLLYDRARERKSIKTEELKTRETFTQGKLFSNNWSPPPRPRSATPSTPGARHSQAPDAMLEGLSDQELILRIEASNNPLVRCEAVKILGKRGKRENTWILLKCLNDPAPAARREAVGALGLMGCCIAVTALIRLAEKDDRFLASDIRLALQRIASPLAIKAVERMTGAGLRSQGF